MSEARNPGVALTLRKAAKRGNMGEIHTQTEAQQRHRAAGVQTARVKSLADFSGRF